MDYYKILGLRKDASKDDIKDAFRKLAMKFHPDRHTKSSKAVQEDAIRRFKEVSEAYDVLSDDKKRAVYCRSGSYYGGSTYRGGYNSHQGTYRGGYSTYQTRASRPNYSHSRSFRFGSPLHYFSTIDFVLHAVLVGVVMGSILVADAAGKAAWRRRNTGKSFEETIYSLHQMKGERISRPHEERDSEKN